MKKQAGEVADRKSFWIRIRGWFIEDSPEFFDPEFQKFAEVNQHETLIRYLIAIGWVGVVLSLGGNLLDRLVYPDQANFFLFLRATTAVIALLVVALLRYGASPSFARIIARSWFLFFPLHVILMLLLTQGFFSPYYFGIALVYGGGMVMPLSYREIVAGGLLTTILYLGACIANYLLVYHPPLDGEEINLAFSHAASVVMFIVLFSIAGHVTNRSRKKDALLRFKLEKSRQELKEMDRLKSEFFANVSHELRTPLTLILAPIGRLREHVPDQQKDNVDLIHTNALRLLRLIDNLLDLIKLDDGELKFQSKPILLSTLLEGLVGLVRPTAANHDLEITFTVADQSLVVEGDQEKLETLFLNLLYNAIKFTPDSGRIDVRLRKEHDNAIIEVSDTGIGIAANNLPRIFDRFWKRNVGRQVKGAGIGLSLVKEIAQKHHGSVAVNSQANHGSTFIVQLPLSNRKAEVDNSIRSATVESVSIKQDDIGSKPTSDHSILIVEDEPDVMRFLVSELSEYALYQATDGEMGLELALEHRPDLIICDIMLPSMDGLSLCRRLHEKWDDHPSNLLVLTARVDDQTRLEALKAGARDFLTKPFSTIELNTRVRNLLERVGLERTLHRKNEELRQSLDRLTGAQNRALQNAHLSAVGNLSAGLMHEIKNPLNSIATAMACLKVQICADPDAVEITEDIHEELERIERIIQELGEMAYGNIEDRRPISLTDVWGKAAQLLRIDAEENLQVNNQLADVSIVANGKQMLLLLTNLVQNAINATRSNLAPGVVRQVTLRSALASDNYQLSVEDNGKGLDPGEVDSFFDPFSSRSDSASSISLGLSICHTIVSQHGGEISVSSLKNESTIITVTLPRE